MGIKKKKVNEMSVNLVVPTDVTVCEAKYSTGTRSLTFAERLGLMGIAPMYHFRYTKLDKHDMRSILEREYPTDDTSAVVDILKRRQMSVHRHVVAHNGLWAGLVGFTGVAAFSLRNYDWKTKAILLTFVAYFGAWNGRFLGNGLVGRWSEAGRDRALGELPAKQSIDSVVL
eukprot:GDKJ01003390.1.p1 GENE.GDKJ01003390.1~~GDKJ01003390.1.p1  ORF type:complete len:172 (+),score=42.35 GDKJ01003390.1:1-516(+)